MLATANGSAPVKYAYEVSYKSPISVKVTAKDGTVLVDELIEATNTYAKSPTETFNSEDALAKDKAKLEKKVSKGVESGAFKPDEAERMTGSLTWTTDYGALRGCRLVIEAATENKAIKRKIALGQLDAARVEFAAQVGRGESLLPYAAQLLAALDDQTAASSILRSVLAEPGFPRGELEALGHIFANTGEIGAATGIEILEDGRLQAVAEPERRGGGSAGVVSPD